MTQEEFAENADKIFAELQAGDVWTDDERLAVLELFKMALTLPEKAPMGDRIGIFVVALMLFIEVHAKPTREDRAGMLREICAVILDRANDIDPTH